jgi:glutamate-5-semialdehyde dehydrogenase
VTDVLALADRARVAARQLATATRATKDAVLRAAADRLEAETDAVLDSNAEDVDRGRGAGLSDALLDRLTLTATRVAGCARGLRQVAALPDPVGDVVRGSTLPNGLQMRQVRVPFGVVGIVYEARPNVTVDAFGLALKSGNAVLLRGSSTAASSNAVLVEVLRAAVAATGLPADSVQLVPADSRDTVKQLLRARGHVDLLIPRGGADLIRTVVEESLVPVIETGVGVCHLYVDASADPDMALALTLDGKTTRPSVCNALETLLVHESVAPVFLPRALQALRDAGVTVHGDAAASAYDASVVPATEDDWAAEYLSLDLAVRVVPSYDEAVAHVRRWSTGHSEAICTASLEVAQRWTEDVDAAAVLVNASTRFTDGEMFGFGAEIGISTQKLHARGPMALPELTTTKFIVTGSGHVRG